MLLCADQWRVPSSASTKSMRLHSPVNTSLLMVSITNIVVVVVNVANDLFINAFHSISFQHIFVIASIYYLCGSLVVARTFSVVCIFFYRQEWLAVQAIEHIIEPNTKNVEQTEPYIYQIHTHTHFNQLIQSCMHHIFTR